MEQQEEELLLVSVVIPNYNCGSYLGRAIESIVNQTESNWELLICDDGSVDNSVTVIKQWQERDSRIKLFINDRNEGHIYTYNRLFNEAKGDYMMIQDADDWSDNRRIEKQLKVLQEFQVQLCLCNSVIHSERVPDLYRPHFKSDFIDNTTMETWVLPTVFFDRSVLENVNGFSHYFDRTTSMDRYFIMSVLSEFKGYYLDEYLYHYQVRPNSDCRSINLNSSEYMRKLIMDDVYFELKKQRIESGTDWLKQNDLDSLKNFEAKLLSDSFFVSEKLRVFACIQIDHNKNYNAWRILKESIKLAPFNLNNYRTLSYLIREMILNKDENFHI